MPVVRLIPAVLICVLISTAASAQEWIDFTSREDRFTVNMPGQPKVEKIEWPSEYGLVFPGRVYTAMKGAEKYSITVIDYSDAEKRYNEKPHPPSFRQAEYWMMDIQGSIQYAATKLYRMKPGVKVTHDAWHYIDLVEGHQLFLTNPDTTRTFASIYLHDNRLYILDGTVPANGPEPGLFTQSLSFLDAEGKRVRYDQIYSNKLPPQTIGNRGGGGGGGGRGRGQGPGQSQ
ncbi:MAG: hypothetical protein ABW292_00665 [Vicinamibacterales bacterium]